MSSDTNVALMKRWFGEVWNRGKMDTVKELLDEHATGFGQAGSGTGIHGPADFIPFVERLRGAFPDIAVTVEDAFGEGEKVVVRWSARMTHTGANLGIAPTKRKVHITGMTMAQIKKGRIVAGWDNWDQLSMLRQLGVVPEAGGTHPEFIERKERP